MTDEISSSASRSRSSCVNFALQLPEVYTCGKASNEILTLTSASHRQSGSDILSKRIATCPVDSHTVSFSIRTSQPIAEFIP